jgi:hypothetical protein
MNRITGVLTSSELVSCSGSATGGFAGLPAKVLPPPGFLRIKYAYVIPHAAHCKRTNVGWLQREKHAGGAGPSRCWTGPHRDHYTNDAYRSKPPLDAPRESIER